MTSSVSGKVAQFADLHGDAKCFDIRHYLLPRNAGRGGQLDSSGVKGVKQNG